MSEGIRANGGTVFGILKDWSERKEHLFDILDMVENTAAEVIPEATSCRVIDGLYGAGRFNAT